MSNGDEQSLSAVMSERRYLINLAYRLLGSLAEAEDAVQETYLRWYALTEKQQQAVESPGAWLTTVAGRICLDQLRSARARRESYVGDWLPEPLPGPALRGPGAADPADQVTLDESVGMAFMVVLESMTPAERVAFILHDVFRYPFNEIAEIVGRTPGACRQLASSARRRIGAAEAPAATPAGQSGIVREFKEAWEAKDIGALIGLLDAEAVAIGDGGGRAVTFPHALEGAEEVAHAWIEIANRMGDALTFHESEVNGQAGLVARQAGEIVTVYAFEVAGERIKRIWAIRNPEKLRAWQAD
jgi:RNA polymerase sigma factor (sigma-70 family)